jgi:hypothetical protein
MPITYIILQIILMNNNWITNAHLIILIRLFNFKYLNNKFKMAQNIQFNYNFLNATIPILKGYLLNKWSTLKPNGKDTIKQRIIVG